MVAHVLLWAAAHPVAVGVQPAYIELQADPPCDAAFPFLDVILDTLDRLWDTIASGALIAMPAAQYAFLVAMLQGHLSCSVCSP